MRRDEDQEILDNICISETLIVGIISPVIMAEEGNDLLNGLVAGYLAKVSPGISKKFKSLHSSPTVAISLDEVVAHFSKTAPPKRKLALGITDGPDIKKTKKKVEESGTSDSESDSSSGEEEGLDNEVEISICTARTEGFLKLSLCFVLLIKYLI